MKAIYIGFAFKSIKNKVGFVKPYKFKEDYFRKDLWIFIDKSTKTAYITSIEYLKFL